MLTTTMGKIAVEARLSRYTVSKILNGDMTVKKQNRDLVLSLCEKHGYVPNHYAVSLVRGKSNIIAILVPYITDGFYSEIIETAEKYASAKGFRTIYQSSYNDARVESNILRGFLALKVSALIMVPVVKDPDIRLHRLISSNIPVIYLDRTVDSDARLVLNDNELSASVMALQTYSRSNYTRLKHYLANKRKKKKNGSILDTCETYSILLLALSRVCFHSFLWTWTRMDTDGHPLKNAGISL